VHINFRPREVNIFECCFHLWLPLFHQRVVVWHVLAVIYSRWRTSAVQILHCSNPPCNLLRLLISLLNRVNVHGSCTNHIFALNIFQFKHRFVFVVKSWFIQHNHTKIFLSSIWFGHFQECINFTDSWDVVRNEGLKLGFQVNLLRLVAINVLKDVLDFLTNG